MEDKLEVILLELQQTNDQLGKLSKGQQALTKGQKQLQERTEHLMKGQEQLQGTTENLEKNINIVLSEQTELKNLIKHTTTLMTENFTNIRQDMKSHAFDGNADVELLFREMAEVKRKVNKLEQK